MRVPVWIGASLYQCCGQPFAVDGQVSWTLTADDRGSLAATLGEHAPRWSMPLAVLASTTREPGDDHHDTGVVVGTGDLRVFIGSRNALFPGPGHDTVEVGLLVEDHHIAIPTAVPPTRGRVGAVAQVRWSYVFDPEFQAYVPLNGSAAVESVLAVTRDPIARVDDREFAGYLVDLDVTT